MKIKVLADDVINKIAAGEVVDRPASVVRELVDNSVDAGATDICVSLTEGGHALIRVQDDGCGMTREDAILGFERHATSKLKDASDLHHISTLGFRGEALPSIAAVSRVRLFTRVREEATGVQLSIEAGRLISVEESACNHGTDIEVSQLFFNTPARRKFLKSVRSEEQRIKEWLWDSSLSRPGIRYRLSFDGREILNLPRRACGEERAAEIIGGNTLRFEQQAGPCLVAGVLAHPSQAEAGQQGLIISVNKRLISDKLIARAVRDGFGGTLKEREFPAGYLRIEIPPTEVDVNVHPQKSEVRFANPQALFVAVRHAVSEAVKEFKAPLYYHQISPQGGPKSAASGTASGKPSQPSLGLVLGGAAEVRREDPAEPAASLHVAERSADYNAAESFRYSSLRYVGEIFRCYLLCEYQDEFYIVDMHAAHERINFNVILQQWQKHSRASQRLLLPQDIILSSHALDALTRRKEILEELGFEFAVSANQLKVLALPMLAAVSNAVELLKEVASISEEADPAEAFEGFVRRIAARIACHASVRSGDSLTTEGALALLARLDQVEFANACPHGRPVVVRFSRSEVEKWFGRDR